MSLYWNKVRGVLFRKMLWNISSAIPYHCFLYQQKLAKPALNFRVKIKQNLCTYSIYSERNCIDALLCNCWQYLLPTGKSVDIFVEKLSLILKNISAEIQLFIQRVMSILICLVLNTNNQPITSLTPCISIN